MIKTLDPVLDNVCGLTCDGEPLLLPTQPGPAGPELVPQPAEPVSPGTLPDTEEPGLGDGAGEGEVLVHCGEDSPPLRDSPLEDELVVLVECLGGHSVEGDDGECCGEDHGVEC